MSKDTEYNFPFRKNYELRIMAVWFVIGLMIFLCPYFIDVPKFTYHAFAMLSGVIGLVLGSNGIEIYIKKSRLKGYPLTFLDPSSNEALKLFNITDKEIIKNVKKTR